MFAAQSGHLEIARLLPVVLADKNAKDGASYTALMSPAGSAMVQIARMFLEAGSDPDLQGGDGRTALILAADNGHLELVRILLEAGADKDLQDGGGYTALKAATEGGNDHVPEGKGSLDHPGKPQLNGLERFSVTSFNYIQYGFCQCLGSYSLFKREGSLMTRYLVLSCGWQSWHEKVWHVPGTYKTFHIVSGPLPRETPQQQTSYSTYCGLGLRV